MYYYRRQLDGIIPNPVLQLSLEENESDSEQPIHGTCVYTCNCSLITMLLLRTADFSC